MKPEIGDREHCSILFDLASSFIHCGIGEGYLYPASLVRVESCILEWEIRSIFPYQLLDLYTVG